MRTATSILVLAVALQGCVELSEAESEIVGEWSWDFHDESRDYFHYGSIKLRRDGKFSRTSEYLLEEVGLSEDGFDIHHFGWLVQGESLCFVDSREARLNREVTDPETQCSWQVRKQPSGDWGVWMWDVVLERHIQLTRSD